LGGSRISRAPFGFAGAKPPLASALVGGLLANFIACSARLRLADGGSRQPSRPIQVSKKERLFAMPQSIR